MKRYTHFSEEERVFISHYDGEGYSIGKIAKILNRSKSSISRELARNSNQTGYNAETAQKRYLSRRQKPCKIDKDATLMISLRLKKFGHLEEVSGVSHESIYRWLYRPAQKKEKLYKLLTQHHGRRGRRKRVHRGGIKDRVSIHQRPQRVLNRQEIGHWEADLMSFRAGTQHLFVLHERKTRYTATIKLTSKKAAETMGQILAFFKTLPRHLVKSVTFDNGTEFAKHRELTKKLNIPTFFCDVYASWQKGGIENMNGRVRRDLP